MGIFEFQKMVYSRLPAAVQRLLCYMPYRYWAGSQYRDTLAFCHACDHMSRAQVMTIQANLLSSVLTFAVEEVPFYYPYRSAVSRWGPLTALKEFPLIDKQTVRQHFDELQPKCIRSIPHHIGTTGGSSGDQLQFLEDDTTYSREMAYVHCQWARVGYSPRSRKATFRGVQFKRITDHCFWQHNPIHNELQFSPFHMSEEHLPCYVEKLRSYNPDFLHGYPSAVDVLAEYVIRHGLSNFLDSLKAVLLVSEACTSDQRARIVRAFGCRTYSFYGHSERVVLGGACEQSDCYHAVPTYGLLELITRNGECASVGDRGEIVGTGFLNRSMPLIRYRTDDTAVQINGPCACGRNWDLFTDVVGRWNLEFVYGRSGTRISGAALNTHGDLFRNVVRYQYFQDTVGKLIIRVIPNTDFSTSDAGKIRQAYSKKLWGELEVCVECVSDIPLTVSGKQLRTICAITTNPNVPRDTHLALPGRRSENDGR